MSWSIDASRTGAGSIPVQAGKLDLLGIAPRAVGTPGERSVPRETPRLLRPAAAVMVLFSEFRRDFVVTKGAAVKPKSGQDPQHQYWSRS